MVKYEQCIVCISPLTKKSKLFLKSTAFWHVTPCSMIDIYECLWRICCLHHPEGGGKRSLRNISDFYQTAWCHTQEGSKILL